MLLYIAPSHALFFTGHFFVMSTATDIILAYHERSKHHFNRYAAGPGQLDWASQPEPFRWFQGSPQLKLPLLDVKGAAAARYVDLYHPGRIASSPLTLANIAAVLELAFGLSAWKQWGANRWALRCNPSSGNLHPTEAYVVVQHCEGIADGVHHYLSRDHVLEQRCTLKTSANVLPPATFLIGLSAIHWREAWKYGERAYRYCQHDAGHAIAAASYAAAVMGWPVRAMLDWRDDEIAALLGLDRAADFAAAERESPDVVLLVGASTAVNKLSASPLLAAARDWSGEANVLSSHHVHDWTVIEDAARACAKLRTDSVEEGSPALPHPIGSPCMSAADRIIKQRRSAQEFDGVSTIRADAFFRMLDLTLPRSTVPPWNAFAFRPRIHLALFVHRVDGLVPGLYIFLRHGDGEDSLRAALSPDFQWQRVAGCPDHLRLFHVLTVDARAAAKALSCHQDIAADGAFSLGMLAEYKSHIERTPWIYRHLYWEAGMVGQVLYLEAEAAGMQGTGIGCFFDDAVHGILGIKDQVLQSIYHFTVGGARIDPRLQSLPGYAHLTHR